MWRDFMVKKKKKLLLVMDVVVEVSRDDER